MLSLTEALGQPAIVNRLLEDLAPPGARALLKGPGGSGKSKILALVTNQLVDSGFVIQIQGDARQAGTRYLGANRALAGTRVRRQLRGTLVGGLTAPLRVIPAIGGAAADLAKIAAAAMGAAPPEFLTGEQQDLLQGLQGLARDRTFGTIVIDQLQWLDADTAQLLLLCLSTPEVAEAFPFARNLRVLASETTDVDATLPTALLGEFGRGSVVECPPATKKAFHQALLDFGMQASLTPQTLDDLYAISRGHLGIAEQIARVDRGTDLPSLLAGGDPERLMAELLSLRLDKLHGAEPLRRLLTIAACSGSAFQEAEVRCAFTDPAAFATALRAAQQEKLLDTDGGTLSFAHDSIRAAAERLASPDAPDVHTRLAACVKRIRPGDYAARLRHTRLGIDAEGREELAFAVAMEEVRGERLHVVFDPAELGGLSGTLADIREAYRLMDDGRHQEAMALVQPLYTGDSGLVQGEIVALLALNTIKLRTSDAYARAVGYLDLWRERRDEPELWRRLMSIRLMALASLGEAEQAMQLYTALAGDLDAASQIDHSLRNRVEALNRKADMFLPSEIAAKHIARAADWFGPTGPEGPPRNAFEHVACLVNLSGALFTLGRFTQAAETAASATRKGGDLHNVGLRVPESYKALNNFAISAYRSGRETASALVAALELGAGGDMRRDRTLVAMNRASLMLLDGRTADGLELMSQVWEHVVDEELDSYYALYARSNLAVAMAVAGDRQGALIHLSGMGSHLGGVPRWMHQAHGRRIKLLQQAFEDDTFMTAREFDQHPGSVRRPWGDQDPWASVGYGFLLSDIQVWSEG